MKHDRLKHNFFNRLSLRESWVIFFALGAIMLNYPFLHIFNKFTLIMNIPLLFFYIFYGWGISILVIFLFTRSIKPENGRQNSSSEK